MTTTSPSATTIRTVDLRDGLTVTIDERGDGSDSTAVLMLHGGAGPRSVAGFAAALSEHARVVTPTHPGFDGQPRPEWFDGIADLAEAYLDLIEDLGLTGVLVVGSSFGGWIAAEMALRDTRGRITGLTLVGAVAVEPEAPLEIAEAAKVGPAEFFRMAYHNPEFRPDLAALGEQQRAVIAANQRTVGIYAARMYDPKLNRRLRRVAVPVLVLSGEQDGIVPPAYGRALADAFPRSRFQVISEAAHFPHQEQLGRTLAALGDFVSTEIKPDSE